MIDKFVLLLRRQYREITIGLNADRIKIITKHNIPLFARVRGKITGYAKNKILKQLKITKSAPLLPCTTLFTSATNLPYAHIIQNRLRQDRALNPDDFHAH
jgi:hypothetical protein